MADLPPRLKTLAFGDNTKLTTNNARRLYPEMADFIKSVAQDLVFPATYADANGVLMENLYDTGVVTSNQDWPAQDARQARLAGAAAPLLVDRPLPQRPAGLAAAATPVQIHLYKEAMGTFEKFTLWKGELTHYLLSRLSEDIIQELKVNGSLQNLSITEFLTTLHRIYGQFNQADLDHCHEVIGSRFTSDKPLSGQVAQMKHQMDLIASRFPGGALQEPDKIKMFIANIQGLHEAHIGEVGLLIGRYKQDTPVLANQTFANLTAYVLERYHPSMLTTTTYGMAHAVVSNRSTAPSSKRTYTQAEVDLLLANAATAITKPSSRAPPFASEPAAKTKFCFMHGFTSTHFGSECRMLTHPSRAKERKASGPCVIGDFSSAQYGLNSRQRKEFLAAFPPLQSS